MASAVSRRAYANSRGVSETAIRKAIRAGRIVPTADGLIDPGQADRNWWRYSQVNPETYAPGAVLDDDFIRRTLAEPVLGDAAIEAACARLLDEMSVPLPADDPVLVGLRELKAEVAALRRELAVCLGPLRQRR